MVLIRVSLRQILQVPIVGRTVCTVVVVGTAVRGSAVRRAVSSSLPTSTSTASGFAWLSPSNDIFTKKTISTDIESIIIGVAEFIVWKNETKFIIYIWHIAMFRHIFSRTESEVFLSFRN